MIKVTKQTIQEIVIGDPSNNGGDFAIKFVPRKGNIGVKYNSPQFNGDSVYGLEGNNDCVQFSITIDDAGKLIAALTQMIQDLTLE